MCLAVVSLRVASIADRLVVRPHLKLAVRVVARCSFLRFLHCVPLLAVVISFLFGVWAAPGLMEGLGGKRAQPFPFLPCAVLEGF